MIVVVYETQGLAAFHHKDFRHRAPQAGNGHRYQDISKHQLGPERKIGTHASWRASNCCIRQNFWSAVKATAQSLSGSKIAKCLLVGLPCIGSIASTDREPHIGEVVPGCIQTLAVCLDLGKSSLGSLGLHAGKHERQGN
eukprot:scaffold80960_cov16-Tisochrysis_lutea.AAC.1